MKRTLAYTVTILAAGAALLPAADFWTSKPFAEWNEKEIVKILSDSPWAKKISVSMEGPAAPIPGAGGGGGGRGGGRGGGGGDDAPAAPISERGGPAGGGGGEVPGGVGGSQVIVRWAASLPLKQAIAKTKYGKEVETSPEAKAFLQREEAFYVLGVIQMPLRGRLGEEYKQALLKTATLTAKGKDSVMATDAQLQADPKTRSPKQTV